MWRSITCSRPTQKTKFKQPTSGSSTRACTLSYEEFVMATPAASLIMTKTRIIDGLSIRYAESAPREVSAILLSPWPESLYTFEQMWPRGRDLQKTKLHNLRTAYGNWNHWSRRFRTSVSQSGQLRP